MHVTDNIKNKDIVIEPDKNFLKKQLISQLAEYIIFGAVLQNKA
jgi:hypothetical protein